MELRRVMQNVERFALFLMLVFWLGIAVMAGVYFFLYRKTPVSKTPADIRSLSVSFPRNDLAIYLPLDNEIVKKDRVTVAGKTIYTKNKILTVTNSGDAAVMTPNADGTFSEEMSSREGFNMVSAYVFPVGSGSRRQQKIFFSYPGDDVGNEDTVVYGTVDIVGSSSFRMSTTDGRIAVQISEGSQLYRYRTGQSRDRISLKDLIPGQTAVVISHDQPVNGTVSGVFVYAESQFASFIGQVKTAGESIDLYPKDPGESGIRLIPRQNFRVLTFHEETGALTPGSLKDVQFGDWVVVDALAIDGKPDVMELRTIILVPSGQL